MAEIIKTYEIPRALETGEIPGLVEDFRRGAERARFANDWPLNPPADPSVWFSFDAAGYTDFPRYGN